MAKSKSDNANPPQVPDDGPTDPAQRRKQTFWTVLICLILIIVTAAMIVNELMH